MRSGGTVLKSMQTARQSCSTLGNRSCAKCLAKLRCLMLKGLTDGSNPNLLGIVISHPHLDHYGLVQFASPLVPKYIGQEADRLLRAASAFTPYGVTFDNAHHYRDRGSFEIGPFRIMPYLVDHSAFDSLHPFDRSR